MCSLPTKTKHLISRCGSSSIFDLQDYVMMSEQWRILDGIYQIESLYRELSHLETADRCRSTRKERHWRAVKHNATQNSEDSSLAFSRFNLRGLSSASIMLRNRSSRNRLGEQHRARRKRESNINSNGQGPARHCFWRNWKTRIFTSLY